MKPSQQKLVDKQFEYIKEVYSEEMLEYLFDLLDDYAGTIALEWEDVEDIDKEYFREDGEDWQEYNCCKGMKKIVPPESKL